MGRGSGGSGRSRGGGGGGGLTVGGVTVGAVGIDNGASGSQLARLSNARAANVSQDRALFIERRSASPQRAAEIDRTRNQLARERFALDFGSRRFNEVYGNR